MAQKFESVQRSWGNKTVVVITQNVECPRCSNQALQKSASYPDHLKKTGECILYVKSCPHCGYWEHVGFVQKHQKAAIENLKQYGFYEDVCRDNPDLVAMKLVIDIQGALVMVRKTGSIQFERIADGNKLTDNEGEIFISAVNSSETLDKAKCYLSLWDEQKQKLKVLYGSLPNIPKSYEQKWEDDLIRLRLSDRDSAEYDQFIGILMN